MRAGRLDDRGRARFSGGRHDIPVHPIRLHRGSFIENDRVVGGLKGAVLAQLGELLITNPAQGVDIELRRAVENRHADPSLVAFAALRRRLDRKCHDPAGDILQTRHAALLECRRNPSGDGIHDRARNQDSARVGQVFEACSNCQRFTVGQIFLEKHIAEMNADAQTHILSLAPQRQLILGFERTPDGVYGAFEQREYSIARHPEKPTVMRLQLLNSDRPYFIQGTDRTGFVRRHHTAEAGDVRRKNRTQAATGLLFFFHALSHYLVTSRICFFILARKVIR